MTRARWPLPNPLVHAAHTVVRTPYVCARKQGSMHEKQQGPVPEEGSTATNYVGGQATRPHYKVRHALDLVRPCASDLPGPERDQTRHGYRTMVSVSAQACERLGPNDTGRGLPGWQTTHATAARKPGHLVSHRWRGYQTHYLPRRP
jgi:hypothetical protein